MPKTEKVPEGTLISLDVYAMQMNDVQRTLFTILESCKDKTQFQNQIMNRLESPLEYMDIAIKEKWKGFLEKMHEEAQVKET